MVEFRNRDDVARWLEGKPREVVVAIAGRATLRVVPLLATAIGPRGGGARKIGHHSILPTLRGAAIAWVAVGLSMGGPDFMIAAKAMASALNNAYQKFFGGLPAKDILLAASLVADILADVEAISGVAGPASIDIAAGAAAYAAASTASGSATAATAIFEAVAIDATAIDSGTSAADLANQRLWLEQPPEWARANWASLRRSLIKLDAGWQVWLDWYQARRDGRPINKVLEVARVLIPDEVWLQGPEVVNAEIKRLIESHTPSKASLPTTAVPAQKPAAMEPLWDKGKLSVPKTAAKSNLSKRKLEAAFAALRAELLELASDAVAEGNIDKRPAQFLQRLAERVPETAPRQDELFRFGHVEAIFAGYAKAVSQEWPDFLAVRYHAVSLQFDRTMRQSPLWREFVANAAKQAMSPAQIADSTALASEAARALQQEEAPTFVDQAVPRALQQLAEALPSASSGEASPDAIEAGKELLAADLVESVNNTLKPIAEVALASAEGYTKEFGKSFEKAAKKQGKVDGEKAFKWLRRLAIGGSAGAGDFVALSNLITRFPEAFGWLERVLSVLK